jgi:hypothetical protein
MFYPQIIQERSDEPVNNHRAKGNKSYPSNPTLIRVIVHYDNPDYKRDYKG